MLRKDKEIQALDLDQQASRLGEQKIMILLGIIGGILLISVVILLYSRNRNGIRQNTEINAQKGIIEDKNKNIIDSIRYARRIHQSFLPTKEMMSELLPNSFVFFQPKDIVSGDFYWLDEKDGKIFFAVVDCTGHGVPGALMSVVGYNHLNSALNMNGLVKPSEILDSLNEDVNNTMSQKKNTMAIRDGMDITLISLDLKTLKLEFSGANNPIYIIRNGKIIKTKGDKQPIGSYAGTETFSFSNHEIQLIKGDQIYMFTDGYIDQFGGPKGKKLKSKKFRWILVEGCSQPMIAQKDNVHNKFRAWQGPQEQVDDILLAGIKV